MACGCLALDGRCLITIPAKITHPDYSTRTISPATDGAFPYRLDAPIETCYVDIVTECAAGAPGFHRDIKESALCRWWVIMVGDVDRDHPDYSTRTISPATDGAFIYGLDAPIETCYVDIVTKCAAGAPGFHRDIKESVLCRCLITIPAKITHPDYSTRTISPATDGAFI
jgi:hypothetical protein